MQKDLEQCLITRINETGSKYIRTPIKNEDYHNNHLILLSCNLLVSEYLEKKR